MPFRLQLPLGIKHPGGRSCADGLFGNVMLVYRDWKISGDTGWLRSLWPFVKKSIGRVFPRKAIDLLNPEPMSKDVLLTSAIFSIFALPVMS